MQGYDAYVRALGTLGMAYGLRSCCHDVILFSFAHHGWPPQRTLHCCVLDCNITSGKGGLIMILDSVIVGPGYVATPIWDRQEIASTVAQYRDTNYAASLESFDKGIIEAVKKGHTPEQIAR